MLPEIRYNTDAKANVQLAFRGLSFSDNYQDGMISDSKMISVRRFPYITTKLPRELDSEQAFKSVYGWNGLWFVNSDNTVTYNGETIKYSDGTNLVLDDSPKKYATMHNKLCIFPDKVYIDTTGGENVAKKMEARASGVGATVTSEQREGEGYAKICTITVEWDVDFTALFLVGDTVKISGLSVESNNKYNTIMSVTEHSIEVRDDSMEAEVTENEVHIERLVPDFDVVCEHNNRLFGSENQVIYVSKLADPTNFWDIDTSGDSAFQFEVASEGQFTGCVGLYSSVIFFKEHSIVKILGDYVANFQAQTYQYEGVKTGCEKSVVNVGETVFYLGNAGVYSYNGGTPVLMSSVFGEKRFSEAVSGTDGENYYMSCKDGENDVFLTYNIKTGLWVREDSTSVTQFARDVNGELHFLSNGNVWKENGDGEFTGEWSVTFKPFYESVSSSSQARTMMFAKKRYSKLIVRTEMAKGAYMKAEVRLDGGVWRECGKTVSFTGIRSTVFPIGRCDKMELRLSGKGEVTILNLEREFHIGSEK